MQRGKLVRLLLTVLLAVAVGFGFYMVNKDIVLLPKGQFKISDYINSGGVILQDESFRQESVPNTRFTGTWSSGANIPSPGSYGGAGVGYTRNDTIFIYCLNGDIDGGGCTMGCPGQLRVYNVNTNTWTNLAPNAGYGRAFISGAIIGNYLYSIGGLSGDAWAQFSESVRRYSIIGNTWTVVQSMQVGTGSSGASGYQDSLMYVVGGFTGYSGSGSITTAVQLYNEPSNNWRQATPLPQARVNGWMWIKGDTIYYGCGAGPSTSTYNNNIFVGVISQTDRANITWTTSSVTYPGTNRHRMDAAAFGFSGIIIGPGAVYPVWWGTGNECYTWYGGNSAFIANPTLPTMTSDAMVGSGSFVRGGWRVWKFVVASGLIMQAPYHILNTQIYTDSVLLTGINGNNNSLPNVYSLSQNYPNPFNSNSKLKFQNVKSGYVKIVVYDVMGREVIKLLNKRLQPGIYEVTFDGSNFNSGVYFYRLTTDGFTDTKKMLLIK